MISDSKYHNLSLITCHLFLIPDEALLLDYFYFQLKRNRKNYPKFEMIDLEIRCKDFVPD